MSEAPACSAPDVLARPEPLDLRRCALFLDVDGTVADLAATPDAVTAEPARTALLERLNEALEGALAVVSGRSLEDLDRILESRVTAAAGVHGLVRRRGSGEIVAAAPTEAVARAAQACAAFARDRPGLLVEDKGLAVALHYRGAPHEQAAVEALADRLAAENRLLIQAGSKVVELRPEGPDKGEAVAAFLRERPFAGRRPVFVGDDLTDEAGFAAAAAAGGYGVVVGPRRPTRAAFALRDVAAVMDWLEGSLEQAR